MRSAATAYAGVHATKHPSTTPVLAEVRIAIEVVVDLDSPCVRLRHQPHQDGPSRLAFLLPL